MCKKKGCKHCDYWYRSYDAEDCPRRYESDSSIISTVILTIFGVVLIEMLYYGIFIK